MMYAVKCEKCGEYDRARRVAEYMDPCEKCGGEIEIMHKSNGFRTYQDDIPGGVVLENLGPLPVKVYSHSERLAIMKKRKLVEMVRHMGEPGTDKSKHTISFDLPPVGDPRPLCMLSIEERHERRKESAERLGVTVEELDRITGPVETFGHVTLSEGDEEILERTGGEEGERGVRNRFTITGSGKEAQEIIEMVREYEHGTK